MQKDQFESYTTVDANIKAKNQSNLNKNIIKNRTAV